MCQIMSTQYRRTSAPAEDVSSIGIPEGNECWGMGWGTPASAVPFGTYLHPLFMLYQWLLGLGVGGKDLRGYKDLGFWSQQNRDGS